MEARKIIHLSETHMLWTVKQITDLLNGSSIHFFLREMRDASRVMRLSKLKNNIGWNLRCVVWPATGGRFYIHVPEGAAQGWNEFLEMLNNCIHQTWSPKENSLSKEKDTIVQSKSSVFAPEKQSKYHYWIRKEKEVFKENFDNLWVLSQIIRVR